MYFHVMLGANDLAASTKFYDATFSVLGVGAKGQFRDEPPAFMYGEAGTGLFLLTKPQDGKDACHANGGTVMFKANSKVMADAWYEAGLANGGSDVSGPPAPGALPNTIMGYLRDPTGNKVAVVAFE
jgi:catechol 2,3-dioxygenase-like lactoylglutathione lyase family enzyme